MKRFLSQGRTVQRKFILPVLHSRRGKQYIRRKNLGWLCLGLFCLGAAFLVSYAIQAPELPPENLLSTLNNVSDYYNDPENSYPSSVVILPSGDEKTWASLSALDDMQTGAGTQDADRSKDISYHIRPGETLSEIAYSYNVPYNVLAYYNNIGNVDRIRVGTIIKIPSLENMKLSAEKLAKNPARTVSLPAVRQAAKSAKISFESRRNGADNGGGITVQFAIVQPPEETLQSFEWDFGDGKRGFRPNPSYEYTVPRTYVARLTARDTRGVIYKSNPLYIDVPHPGSAAENTTTKFVTLSSPEDFFVVNGNITDVARYADVESAPLDFSESDQFLTKVRFKKSGYYGLTVTDKDMVEQYYSVFVSPIASIHADISAGDFNWYRTQYNTGTSSNCGPAVASMAIGWALGKYVPVASVRESIGWQGNGGTSFDDFMKVIRSHGIPASMQPLRSLQNIKDIIDSGNVAIILFHTQGISQSPSNPEKNLFGRYYNDSVGHYVIIKGYSLNGEYFVAYDPIPNDWSVNSFRYGDELSMVGRNRYYSSSEILKSLRRNDMMVIPRVIK